MPTSATEGKDTVRYWYEQLKPTAVVDVGCGEGTYAKLLRHTYPAHWVGIEAWGPYVERYGLDRLYDEVHIADARVFDWNLIAGLNPGLLIIAGDVLEHMPRNHARALITQWKQVTDYLLVSIPILHLDQGAVNGNPFERHVDHWTAEAMRTELGTGITRTWVGRVLAYFLWERAVAPAPVRSWA